MTVNPAEYARRRADSDELLAALRVLNGFDIDLAADQNRLASRLRDALTSVYPVPETGRRGPPLPGGV